jgi:23S rRNA-/tRNA-specific pseudouridylate synthase
MLRTIMSPSTDVSAIGFPPPVLGKDPLRLPVIADSADWLALDKPAGIGVRDYPWDQQVPDLDTALNLQLRQGKPELKRLDASLFGSVYYLDPEVSGVCLFGKSREAVASLRNSYGSGQCEFTFYLIASDQPTVCCAEEQIADAPLLAHNTKPKMIPSTAKGKQATTKFGRIEAVSTGWALWQATVTYIRPHQVRAHAVTVGISIIGDTLYGGPTSPSLRDLDPSKRGSGVGTPLFHGVALHLAELRLPENDVSPAVSFKAALPRPFSALLKRLKLPVPSKIDCG